MLVANAIDIKVGSNDLHNPSFLIVPEAATMSSFRFTLLQVQTRSSELPSPCFEARGCCNRRSARSPDGSRRLIKGLDQARFIRGRPSFLGRISWSRIDCLRHSNQGYAEGGSDVQRNRIQVSLPAQVSQPAFDHSYKVIYSPFQAKRAGSPLNTLSKEL